MELSVLCTVFTKERDEIAYQTVLTHGILYSGNIRREILRAWFIKDATVAQEWGVHLIIRKLLVRAPAPES